MTPAGYKRLALLLGILTLALAAVGSVATVRYAQLRLRLMLADEQTRIFEEMRLRALKADTSEALDCLQYAWHYYPSGTKQVAGSRLDRMVEQARASAAREIVAHLRAKTGKDYGDGPEDWLRAYGRD